MTAASACKNSTMVSKSETRFDTEFAEYISSPPAPSEYMM